MKVKWVFKKKNEQDGSVRYKGRIVVKGFVQIPGVDFTHSHSPVAGDATIRTILAVCLYMGWECDMLDIEAAFLEADLEETMYIEWPKGMVELGYMTKEEAEATCAKLEKAMYGCVQSPRAFYKELSKELKAMGMIQSKSDPCVWFNKPIPTLIIICYVDDIVMVGKREEVDWFKTRIQKRFKISDLGKLKKHLGVWYERDANGFTLKMDKYCQDIVMDWKMATGNDPKPAATSGYPGETLNQNEGPCIKKDLYRKLLGKVMWLAKKVLPECVNAVRELAMFMDNPGEEQWRAMNRLMCYLSVANPVFRMCIPKDLKPMAFIDSNFATSKFNRKSVTGFVTGLGGCPIIFASKTQPTVSLSSTEAEYIAASMGATELKFMCMLLSELVPNEVIRPATIHEDNTGAIFLMENMSVGPRTKHIDIRWHHLRSLIEDSWIKVQFVRSAANVADLCTKNLPEKDFVRHRERICGGMLIDEVGATDD